MCVFGVVSFGEVIFQHHSQELIFKTFYTNLNPIFFSIEIELHACHSNIT
jgi:hypothetical protein